MQRTARAIGILSAALAVMACGGGDDDGNGGDRCDDAPTFAEVSALQVCVNCHSSSKMGDDRTGAPGDVNFDTYDAAAQNAQRGANQVAFGLMPPPGEFEFSLTPAQRETLEKWAECGAPR
ncbi:MAG TPA: hypothetical protein VI072_15000 [Polyangiaceae bacterium]